MKFKKILSLLVSSALTFSAFTAVVSAYSKKGTVTIGVTQIDETTANAYMQALGKDDVAEGYGVFSLGVTVGDLGEFSFTKSSTILGTTYLGTSIAGIQLQLAGTGLESLVVMSGEDATKLPVTAAQLEDGVQYSFAASSAAVAFPKETVSSDNYSADFTALVYAPLGTNVSAGGKTLIAFNNAGAWADNATYELTVNPTTLGTAPSTASIGIAIDKTGSPVKENGYIWDCTLTQNNATAETFTAEFKSGEDKVTKTAENFGTFVNSFGGAGSVEFKVGLKTNKVIDSFKATVTGTEGTSATDTWTPAQ